MVAGSGARRDSHGRHDSHGGHGIDLITDARRSPVEERRQRKRLYTVLQVLRLPLFLASGVVWWLTGSHLWAVLLVAISLPLPWVAVLLANDPGSRDKGSRSVYKPAVVREQRRQLGEFSAQQLGAGRAGVAELPSGGDMGSKTMHTEHAQIIEIENHNDTQQRESTGQ